MNNILDSVKGGISRAKFILFLNILVISLQFFLYLDRFHNISFLAGFVYFPLLILNLFAFNFKL